MRHVFAAFAAVVVLLGGAVLSASSASADVGVQTYELDYASPASGEPPVAGTLCDSQLLRVCFAKYGDVWWVKDTTNDGYYNLELQWENRLFDGSAWFLYREGSCTSQLGYNNYGTCNKDYYESSSLNKWDSYGSQVRFRPCTGASSCGSWSSWIDNDA
ncbi:MAG: hypothetical protein HOV94_26995 [Saccharothrix sp.]|nr:hypothetical protein [Saccharothrix sp.]